MVRGGLPQLCGDAQEDDVWWWVPFVGKMGAEFGGKLERRWWKHGCWGGNDKCGEMRGSKERSGGSGNDYIGVVVGLLPTSICSFFLIKIDCVPRTMMQ